MAKREWMWRAQQDDLATLVPTARHPIARQSGHCIQLDQPALVIEAIRQVVAAVQRTTKGMEHHVTTSGEVQSRPLPRM